MKRIFMSLMIAAMSLTACVEPTPEEIAGYERQCVASENYTNMEPQFTIGFEGDLVVYYIPVTRSRCTQYQWICGRPDGCDQIVRARHAERF